MISLPGGTSLSRRGFLAGLAAALPALPSCTPARERFDTGDALRVLPEAPQRPHPQAVPHTTRSGAARSAFDPRDSFFPIGAYHAVSDERPGRGFRLVDLPAAGFNSVVAWGGQDASAVAEECRRHGLQVVLADPGDAAVRRLAGDPAVLAYDVDHEPSVEDVTPASWERLARFRARRARIRELDPGRAVLTVDSPSSSAPRRERWLAWADAGDVAAHWKYPFTTRDVATLGGERGLPETLDLARGATGGRKPLWHVGQAFASPHLGWRLPNERELRAIAYAALIHGATGIFWFALDSFVTRDGQVLGFAPAPAADYRVALDPPAVKLPPLVADADALRRSAATWTALARLNAELRALAPAILSPTPEIAYSVAVRGRYASPTPVRTLLKRTDGGWTLLAVNIDDAPLEVEYRLPAAIKTAQRSGGGPAPVDVDGERLRDRLPPFGAASYRLAT